MNAKLKGAPFADMSRDPNSDSSGSPWHVQLSSFVWKFLSLDHVENIAVYIYIYYIECLADKRSSTEWIQETYFAAVSLFRSRLLSRATKIILYKTLITPVVSYGAEAWTLTKKE